MPNIRALLDAVPVPAIPSTDLVEWPALTRIDFSHNTWHFHYSDGSVHETSDPKESEMISRLYFSNEGKNNQ